MRCEIYADKQGTLHLNSNLDANAVRVHARRSRRGLQRFTSLLASMLTVSAAHRGVKSHAPNSL